MFVKATKTESKLRLAIAGPAGSGKTMTSLKLARALAGASGKVAVIDTEHGSASKYADLVDFDVMQLAAPYRPDRFIDGIKAAERAGYDVVVVDSLSHEWEGAGGVLEMKEKVGARIKNDWAAWAEVTPLHQALIEAILTSSIHVICTMRSKMDYTQVEKNGKKTIEKLGMAPRMRDGIEYEFDLFAEMDVDNKFTVTKSRCPAMHQVSIYQPKGTEIAATLLDWLSGAPPVKRADPEELKRAAAIAGVPIASVVAEAQTRWGRKPSELTAEDGAVLLDWIASHRMAAEADVPAEAVA